jgi:hypothetical protein
MHAQYARRSNLRDNDCVRRLLQPWFALAATLAGCVAAITTAVSICVIAVLAIPHLSPGAFYEGPANSVGRLAFRLAGVVGVVIGGYVAARLANRSGRSEIAHAILVGFVFSLLGIMLDAASADPRGPDIWPVVVVSMLAAMIGGWLSFWQVWRRKRQAGHD